MTRFWVALGVSALSFAAGISVDWHFEGGAPWTPLLLAGMATITLASAVTLGRNVSLIQGVLHGLLYGSLGGAFFLLAAADTPGDAWVLPIALAALGGAIVGTACGVVAWLIRLSYARVARP